MTNRRTLGLSWGFAVVVAGLVWAGLSPAVALADQVTLKNGDKLTGQVLTLDAGKLTIKVLGLGDVKVDVGQIVTVATDGPVDVRLADGTAEKRRLLAYPAGGVVIEGGLVPNLPTALAQISRINPPASVWTGSILAGALLSRGNTQTDSVSLGVNVSRKTDQDDIAVVGSYLYGRTHDRTTGVVTTTTENWQAEARYDYNFTKRFYGFLDFLVRKDRIALLDLRLVPSGGLGYKFIDEPDLALSGELGLAWVYEKYTNSTATREDVSGRAAYHVLKKFNDKVSVFHDLEYLQSVQRGPIFHINTDLGLHAQLTTHFFSEAKITLSYDSAPANGALKSDVFYAVNLGYNF